MDQQLVARFASLFRGYSKAFGQYTAKHVSDTGKVDGRANTIRAPVTLEIFERHLTSADSGMGIIPLTDDDKCAFAVIDIDERNVNHAQLIKTCERFKLPLVTCRSKSGGAHLYLFCKPAAPAQLVRDKMAQWAALLGYAGCEVFPKQSSRDGDHDVGNWINLPYQNAVRTVRMGFGPDGNPLTLLQFLEYAEASYIDESVLTGYSMPTADEDMALEAPPCLSVILGMGGFYEGSRNEGMFSLSVYLRKRFPDNFEAKFQEYNLKYCTPSLSANELQTIIKSSGRKDYGYRCQQPPIKQHCQKRVCTTRQFGIGGGGAEEQLEIGDVVKYESSPNDPVQWSLEVSGQRLTVQTEVLYDLNAFNRVCMERLHRIPVQMSAVRWRKYLDGLLRQATVVQEPEDSGPSGQLYNWIEQFCLQRARARSLDEIFTGRPYVGEDGRVYFRSMDLFAYLNNRRVEFHSTQSVWRLLKEKGAQKVFKLVGGKGVNLWHLPEPTSAVLEAGEDPQLGKEEF